MLNRLIALTFLCLMSGAAFSQLDFGIKGGASSSGVIFQDLEEGTSLESISSENSFGWHAGLYARVKVLGIYLQPEFIYSQLNSTLSAEKNSGETSTSDFQLSRLDIPVNLGIKFGPASIFGGPVMSYNLNHPSEIFEVDYKNGTLGYQAGVGLTLGNFIIDLKYEGSFQKLADEVVIGGESYKVDARTGQVILSLGYALF